MLAGLRACCGARVLWVSGRPPIYACGWGVGDFVVVRGPVALGVFGTAGVAGVRVYFWARIRWVFGSSGVGAFCVRLRVFLFVMRWIVPLCLILTAFFPPSPERVETSAQKPLICGDNAYAVGLMVGVRGK